MQFGEARKQSCMCMHVCTYVCMYHVQFSFGVLQSLKSLCECVCVGNKMTFGVLTIGDYLDASIKFENKSIRNSLHCNRYTLISKIRQSQGRKMW